MTTLQSIKNLQISDFTEKAKIKADKVSSKIFKEIVPEMGVADTVAGEIACAMNSLVYRYYNDGDTLFYCKYSDSVYVDEYMERVDSLFMYIEYALHSHDDKPEIKEAKEILADIKRSLNGVNYDFLMFKLQLLVNEITKKGSVLREIENNDDCWDFADESDEDYYKKIGLRP